jgi:hypothetical protein
MELPQKTKERITTTTVPAKSVEERANPGLTRKIKSSSWRRLRPLMTEYENIRAGNRGDRHNLMSSTENSRNPGYDATRPEKTNEETAVTGTNAASPQTNAATSNTEDPTKPMLKMDPLAIHEVR